MRRLTMQAFILQAFILATAVSAAILAIPGNAGIHGAAKGYGPFSIYDTHAHLVSGATTPSVSWTLTQQGFYGSGDGGSASYDWNASSYCSINTFPGGSGTSGSPTPADGLTCILPSGQSASTAGRYLLRTANGAIDARQLGFRDDGVDNASLVATLNSVLITAKAPVVFSTSRVYGKANYWFSQPLDIASAVGVSCASGTRPDAYDPAVNLVFEPGVDGVRFIGNNQATLAGYSTGHAHGNLSGCGIISTGYGESVGHASNASSTTISYITRITTPQQVAGDAAHPGGARQAEPVFAVGDSIVMFPWTQRWYFSGSISGNVLTVSTTPTAYQLPTTDPGIAVGQMLQDGGGAVGTSLPHGIYIAATHAENASYTGTGGTGTYLLSSAINAPPVAPEAVSSNTIGTEGFDTEVQSGQPMDPPGTTVVSCRPTCAEGNSMVLSNAPNQGVPYVYYLLPGPNSAKGSQMYNITTSLTGHTSTAITGSISGATLTVTSGPTLKLGQKVIGTAGSNVTATIRGSSLTLGQTSIPVSSCSGIQGIANGVWTYVVGFNSGNSVFQPGALVNSCVGTTLTIYTPGNMSGQVVTTSGSPVVKVRSYYIYPGHIWIGEPVTGTNIPANSTIQSWAFVSYNSGYINLTLNNNATGSNSSGSINLGGAINAAPVGTTLTFLTGSAYVTAVGGRGAYTLDTSGGAGTALYAYDTPATVYITGGPRNILPGELIWSDAFPFGTISAKIYGSSPSNETVIVSTTDANITYNPLAATVAHSSGSGQMWVLPSGVWRGTEGATFGDIIIGFGVGINGSCHQDLVPQTGCGQSNDSYNAIMYSMVGRLIAGNNSGGSGSTLNEYDHNYVADIAELGTVGSTYIGEEMQGPDEGSNTHVLLINCGTNGSPFVGAYTSGAGWEGHCVPTNVGMVSSQTVLNQDAGGPWLGAIYEPPYTPFFVNKSFAPQINCAPRSPTSSVTVVNGVVTHC
jgi:hypothetical protein